MKRLLVVAALIAAGVLALGFHQGWFRLSRDTGDAKVNVTLTVDQDKIKDDTHRAEQQFQELGRGVKDRISPSADKGKD